MLHREGFDALPEERTPEIERLPLASVILDLLTTCTTNSAHAPLVFAEMLGNPSMASIDADRQLLESLHLTIDGQLTHLGHSVAHLPCHQSTPWSWQLLPASA